MTNSAADTADDPRAAPAPLARFLQSDLVVLALAFAATRIALYALGLRFNLILDWMFLADLKDLEQHGLETAFYFHAFPPGMNLLTSGLLAISESHLAGVAHAVFLACGLLIAGCLMHLLRVVGLGRRAALVVALSFSLIPQSLYFENLYLYDYPVPALLSLSAVLFHRAFLAPSFRRWFWFFLVCAVLGWIRSALHLVWFLALLTFAFAAVRAPARRMVLVAAAAPLVLLLSLYVKNYAVFGVFDSQSQSGGNFTLITTHHMPRGLRKQWVAEGKISPFADMSFAAPPRNFLPFFPSEHNPAYPHNQGLDRPTQHAPNYNHWFFLSVNEKRRADARYCLSQRPGEYVRNVVARALPQAFSPSTRWHPRTGTPASPHAQHRQVLGAWEDVYNAVVHGFPVKPYGLYLLLPVCLGWVLVRGYRRLCSGSDSERALGALTLSCAIQILYLIAVTALLTYGENARYRYIIEPFIWVVCASALHDLSGYLRSRRARQRSAVAATPAG
jgi:hypothetical protein